MKDVQFEIEVLEPILANTPGPGNQRDKFARDRSDKLIFQQSWWHTALTKSMEMSGVTGIKPGDIHINLLVRATTKMYQHKYGINKIRTHEAIMRGSILTIDAVVADHVTESNLRAILERMGAYVGLSPFGWNMGYGRFNLKSLHVAPSSAAKPETTG